MGDRGKKAVAPPPGETWTIDKKYEWIMKCDLQWPSTTVQWLPRDAEKADGDGSLHKLILGTKAPAGKQNHLMIASVRLPNNDSQDQAAQDDDGMPDLGGLSSISGRIKIVAKLKHEGAVHRARYMPQDPSIVATKTSANDVLVFYTAKNSSEPDLRLRGQKQTGYGLSWNAKSSGKLLSASYDHTICLWDINATPQKDRTLDAITTFTGHTAGVEDVAWNPLSEWMFGSVSQDGKLLIWDTRCPPSKTRIEVKAHSAKVNCLTFSPFVDCNVCTGSSDRSIGLWDLRNLRTNCASIKAAHTDEVLQVHFHPEIRTILASSGADTQLNVTDVFFKRLVFPHCKHSDRISDFSWNPEERWVFCSVAENKIMQIWQMSEIIYKKYEADAKLQQK